MENSDITLVSPTTKIVGNLEVQHELHFYGQLLGEIRGAPGSTIHIKEGSLVEGKIIGDHLVIEGFVKGEVVAQQRTWITGQGKLVGNLKSPTLSIDPGAIFEAQVSMI